MLPIGYFPKEECFGVVYPTGVNNEWGGGWSRPLLGNVQKEVALFFGKGFPHSPCNQIDNSSLFGASNI